MYADTAVSESSRNVAHWSMAVGSHWSKVFLIVFNVVRAAAVSVFETVMTVNAREKEMRINAK